VAATEAPTTSSFTLNVKPTSAFGTLSGVTSLPVTFANGAMLKVTPTPGMNIRVRGLVFVILQNLFFCKPLGIEDE
jgi:hypothetical protein